MNVTELARKLKVPTKELLEILPVVGFDIGRRAIKIDDRQAARIVEQWPKLKAKYRELTSPAEDKKAAEIKTETVVPKQVAIPPTIRVKDLAERLKYPLSKLMAELMKNGVLASMNEEIDFDTASIVSSELGYEVTADQSGGQAEEEASQKLEQLLIKDKDGDKNLIPRPPVVVVMGHVDHGKTKLLDAIRKTNVIEGESGGITQHIGAYQVIKKDNAITFIDTPGHEAFTTMRSRGARVADIAILVIAADDSIQPQTKESIKIIKSAKLPMIVVINKIDKPDANPERVKQDLASLNLVPEEWGGNTIVVPISAKAGTGIDELLDMILLVTETERVHITANPAKPAVGTIIESHVDKGEGPVATMLVQNGTLKRGDLVEISGSFYGKVRSMKDYKGQDIETAPPSTPVKIIGLKASASVGDILQVTLDVDKKKKVSKYQLNQQAVDYSRPRETSDQEKKNVKTLNVVLRSDVLGSLEAIIASLTKLDHPEVAVNVIAKGLGNITENDVQRAASAEGLVLGFHVKPTQSADLLARDKKVEIKNYEIIYKLLEDVKARLEQMLTPEVIRTDLGRLKVLAVFRKEDKKMVIGGQVIDGRIPPMAKVDVKEDKFKKATGIIAQVQVNKVKVTEAVKGQECGISYEGKPVIVEGDILEAYTEEIRTKKIQ
ncbi:MAG: translation initiation factor IF-2 [Candidatus Buchananbacteria bacterium]|nr:translation initiation factor IF-2 [Candidatus Buchananbacteria bacterium]